MIEPVGEGIQIRLNVPVLDVGVNAIEHAFEVAENQVGPGENVVEMLVCVPIRLHGLLMHRLEVIVGFVSIGPQLGLILDVLVDDRVDVGAAAGLDFLEVQTASVVVST